jgi:hypothetical protein
MGYLRKKAQYCNTEFSIAILRAVITWQRGVKPIWEEHSPLPAVESQYCVAKAI